MYLLTFVIVLISILGLYANVMALQATKIAEKQTVIGSMMQQWNGAAYATALDGGALDNPGTGGCSLTPGFPTACTRATVPVQVTLPSDFLPPGYSTDYIFNSIYYAPAGLGGQRLLITFVPPVTDAFGTLQPNGIVTNPPLGIPLGEVFRQLQKTTLDPISYGYVTTQATIQQLRTRGGRDYPVPTGGIVPDGSLAIISSPP